MVPAVYLLDFENVNSLEFLDLTVLNDEDEIHFFYTEHCPKISLDMLNGLRANMSVHKITSGNQEVDMHIAAALGYCVCRHNYTND